MSGNLPLAIVSIVLLFVFAGAGLIEHLTQAEAIAEDLAPQIGVDKDVIRAHLERILQKGSIRRTVVYCSPLAILSFLLTARLLVDIMRGPKRRHP